MHAKRLAVLGSTGSIGRQTLEVVRSLPEQFRVVGLAAARNAELLAKQVNEFKPEFLCYPSTLPVEAHSQRVSLEELASHPNIDVVMIATSGKAGLEPTLAAARAGKRIALANKEALVMAGAIVTAEAERSGSEIMPVDSEHSAIWQCLNGETRSPTKVILTASGGPFRGYSPDRVAEVTVEQALKHPCWVMGRKVTIDSATLMNKGLEVIEAHWLFGMPFERIEVIVHPESIIHSMVEFADGSIKAQLSYPDMRLPIQYALTFPGREANPSLPRLNLKETGKLTFGDLDPALFPCLGLAVEAGRKGGTYPAVLCGADEAAVDLFLQRRIRFTDIATLVKAVLDRHQGIATPSLDEILQADDWARREVDRQVEAS